MTELTKDRLQDVAVFVVALPFALVLSPLLVLWWMCDSLHDCWHEHASRHRRNEWIRKEAERTSVPGKQKQ